MFKTLYRASIWAPGAIPIEEWKYRNMKRIMFPVVDVLLYLGGRAAQKFGVPAITEFYPDWFVDTFSYILSFFAIICFIGVVFPRMWVMEILGKSVIFGLLFGYAVALTILIEQGYHNRGFSLLITLIAMCPIVWRLSMLASEWQERRQEDKAAKVALDAEKGGE